HRRNGPRPRPERPDPALAGGWRPGDLHRDGAEPRNEPLVRSAERGLARGRRGRRPARAAGEPGPRGGHDPGPDAPLGRPGPRRPLPAKQRPPPPAEHPPPPPPPPRPLPHLHPPPPPRGFPQTAPPVPQPRARRLHRLDQPPHRPDQRDVRGRGLA